MTDQPTPLAVLYVERFQFNLDQQMTFLRFGLAAAEGEPVMQVALAMTTALAAELGKQLTQKIEEDRQKALKAAKNKAN